jgi:hypothetical protein
MTRKKLCLSLILAALTAARFAVLPDEREIREGEVRSEPLTFQQKAGTSRQLTRFECLSSNRLLPRTTFRARGGELSITVNFDGSLEDESPPFSATVSGPIEVGTGVYRATSE